MYAFLWATMRGAPDAPEAGPTMGAGRGGARRPLRRARQARAAQHQGLAAQRQPARPATLLGVLVLATAAVIWLGSAGIGIRLEVVLPIVAIVIGAIFFWSQLDDADPIGARRPVRWIWLVVGLGLTSLGLVGLLVGGTDIGQLWQVAGAVLAALVGVAVLSAPWILRLWTNLRDEQAARIRATERADIAAHLHDSVLQTLALIQRKAGDAATVARLARAQERELRSLPLRQDARAGTLGAALTAAMRRGRGPARRAGRARRHRRPAAGRAPRRARQGGARGDAGTPSATASHPSRAYVEVGPDAVEAFVRDHGTGFDLDDVPDDRPGCASRSSAGWSATAAPPASAGARTAPRSSCASRSPSRRAGTARAQPSPSPLAHRATHRRAPVADQPRSPRPRRRAAVAEPPSRRSPRTAAEPPMRRRRANRPCLP